VGHLIRTIPTAPPAALSASPAPVVDDAIAVPVFSVRHAGVKLDALFSPFRHVVSIDLPLLGLGIGLIGLQEGGFDLVRLGIERKRLEDFAFLSELIGGDDVEASLTLGALHALGPFGISFAIPKIAMKATDDLWIAQNGAEGCAEPFGRHLTGPAPHRRR